jgi:S-adenosylmethionine decarboxylase
MTLYFANMIYQPGSHLIASLKTPDAALIGRAAGFPAWLSQLIEQYRLRKLGEVFHDFEPYGFTAVVCLSESHISIHTWPEHLRINLDIYLSNHERVNDATVQALFEKIKAYFQADTITVQTITR